MSETRKDILEKVANKYNVDSNVLNAVTELMDEYSSLETKAFKVALQNMKASDLPGFKFN